MCEVNKDLVKETEVEKEFNIEVKVVGVNEFGEVTCEINGVKAEMVEDDGMIWFCKAPDENYNRPTIVFPTAESLLKAIQICHIAKNNDNQWIKNSANVIKQALDKGYELNIIALFCRYSDYLLEHNIITEEQFDELYNIEVCGSELEHNVCYAMLEGLFLDWSEHCFFNNMNYDAFIKETYKDLIKASYTEDAIHLDESKESGYPWYSDHGEWSVEDEQLLYHLTPEEKEIALKELESEELELDKILMFTKALVKILEEILNLADNIEEE